MRAKSSRLGYWFRSRLHRRIFVWFGASIITTGVTVLLVLSLISPDRVHEDWSRLESFVSEQYGRVWDRPRELDEMTRIAARDLEVRMTVRDATGRVVSHHGRQNCAEQLRFPVERNGEVMGSVALCSERGGRPWMLALALLVACCTLWAFSGVIARRLVRPLNHVVQVAHDIGQGRLESRVRTSKHRMGEVAMLADAINDMASRIEKQLRDQKELLAAVSHESRTPLGHIRILLESLHVASEAGKPADAKTIDELEREVLELDSLVGELLASSRLSFETLQKRPLEALDVAVRALERAGLSIDKLECDADSIPFDGDATLIGRALANLLENAKRHAGSVARLVIEADADYVTFSVEDEGPGFVSSEVDRVFESFFRGEWRAGANHGSLGLGLALVKRIAVAHGGRAWAANRTPNGARVSFQVERIGSSG